MMNHIWRALSRETTTINNSKQNISMGRRVRVMYEATTDNRLKRSCISPGIFGQNKMPQSICTFKTLSMQLSYCKHCRTGQNVVI